MALFFRKLSDIFTGKYKKDAAPDKTKPFWDVKEEQDMEKAGFSKGEAKSFIDRMKAADKSGEMTVDFRDIMHIGEGYKVTGLVDDRTVRMELKQGDRPAYAVNKKVSSSEMKYFKKSADCTDIILQKLSHETAVKKLSLTNRTNKSDVPAQVVADFVKDLHKTHVTSLETDLGYGKEMAVSLGAQMLKGKMTELTLSSTSKSNGLLRDLNLGKSALTSLTLNSSDLGETCLEVLGQEMPETLTHLSLTNRPNSPDIVSDEIGLKFVQSLPENLQSLKLENIRLSPAAEKALGERLMQMPALKEFVYNGPDVTDASLEALAPGLAASSVEKTDFSEVTVTNKGVNSFLNVLEKAGSKIKETGFLKKSFDFGFCPKRDLEKTTVDRIQKFEQTGSGKRNGMVTPAVHKTLFGRNR